ncbi:MAG: hypothetical protein AAF682_21320, partial [Planctomycetota bacterium]
MTLAQLTLVWSRPAGLAALLLPLLLLLLARVRTKPPVLATGTLSIWKAVSDALPREARSHRPRIPLAIFVLALALALGAVALAGPRFEAPAGRRTWTVLVDQAPSTALPWRAEAGEPGGGLAESRIERALAEARRGLAEAAQPGDRVRWVGAAAAPLDLAAGEEPPAEWFAPPPVATPRPVLARYDRPGTLLVSDRPPTPEPRRAGWFASGGAAVHGPVSADREGLWVWDGERVERRAGATELGRVALDETRARLPGPVRAVVEDWAAPRGRAEHPERSGIEPGRVEGRARAPAVTA